MSKEHEKTLILIKPDGVQRGLVGDILSRFEHKGLKVIALRMLQVTKDMAENHYGEHKEKPFFGGLIEFITAAPIVAIVVEGNNAISVIRKMVGATNPQDAAPGTIRHDFGMHMGRNLIHASDSTTSAEKEIGLFFETNQIIDWKKDVDYWVYE
ncbi:nucleoside-diphosphate kinase [archaeon]|nr:nucleoside-diphosphate kinase [archaeon]